MHNLAMFYHDANYEKCNNKMKFVEEVFLREGYDNEAIVVNLNSALNNEWKIDIRYSCIKNHKQTSASTHIPQTLLLTLSDTMMTAICQDLLKAWRTK